LTEYDLSSLKPVRFEFQPKGKSITMRLSEPLLEAIKEEAEGSYPISVLSAVFSNSVDGFIKARPYAGSMI